MKKFFLFVAAVAAAMTVNAADKTWNFTALFNSENVPTFTVGDGATPDVLIKNEVMVYGNAKDKAWALDFGQSAKYFVDFLTAEDQDAEGKLARLKSGGAGAVEAGKIKGAIAFKVAGSSTIKIAAVSSSGSDTRKMQVLDGNGTEIASFKFDGNIGKKVDGEIVTEPFVVNYTGAATTIYIISAAQVTDVATDGYKAGGINFYKIAATNVADWNSGQGIEDLNDGVKAVKVFENGQLVIIKNGVRYNALGAAL